MRSEILVYGERVLHIHAFRWAQCDAKQTVDGLFGHPIFVTRAADNDVALDERVLPRYIDRATLRCVPFPAPVAAMITNQTLAQQRMFFADVRILSVPVYTSGLMLLLQSRLPKSEGGGAVLAFEPDYYSFCVASGYAYSLLYLVFTTMIAMVPTKPDRPCSDDDEAARRVEQLAAAWESAAHKLVKQASDEQVAAAGIAVELIQQSRTPSDAQPPPPDPDILFHYTVDVLNTLERAVMGLANVPIKMMDTMLTPHLRPLKQHVEPFIVAYCDTFAYDVGLLALEGRRQALLKKEVAAAAAAATAATPAAELAPAPAPEEPCVAAADDNAAIDNSEPLCVEGLDAMRTPGAPVPEPATNEDRVRAIAYEVPENVLPLHLPLELLASCTGAAVYEALIGLVFARLPRPEKNKAT